MGGWKTVTAPPPRPAGGMSYLAAGDCEYSHRLYSHSWATCTPSFNDAATLRYLPPPGKAAEAKEKAADALSDKQRKNRRKAQN